MRGGLLLLLCGAAHGWARARARRDDRVAARGRARRARAGARAVLVAQARAQRRRRRGRAALSAGGDDAIAIARALRIQIQALFVEFLSADGGRVDYARLRASAQFGEYVAQARALRGADARALAPAARKAFFLNLYNALLIHAVAALHADAPPGGLLARLKLYATASYDVGGVALSLNDIEHGVLRANRPGAAPFSRPQFADGDGGAAAATAGLALPLDARIHFALNCGASSCPPIRFYDGETAAALDDDLDLAAAAFLEQEVAVEGRELTLSQLFEWYRADFVDGAPPAAAGDVGGGAASADDAAVVRWIAKHTGDAPGEGLRGELEELLRTPGGLSTWHATYDWASIRCDIFR